MPKAKEKRKDRKGKGKYCVAFGCSSTYSDNVSLHLFPRANKRPEIRRQWISFVRSKRKDFDNPSDYMCLCEKHFEDSCYPQKFSLMKCMGMENAIGMKTLLPNAVPTIHTIEKTRAIHQSPATMGSQDTESIEAFPVPGPSFTSPRSAYRKRECLRIISTFDKGEEQPSLDSMDDINEEDTSNVQTLQSVVSRGTQAKLRTPKKSVSSQTRPKYHSKAIQVDLQRVLRSSSVSIQCGMQFAEFTGKIMYPTKYKPEGGSVNYESASSGDTDVETNSMNSPVQEECNDDDFVLPSDYETESEEETDDRDTLDSDSDTNCARDSEMKYIIYHSKLLSLFENCPMCHGPTIANITHRVGSMIRIEQQCSCGHLRKWCSQPMVGAIPSGNLEMSASILFSGAQPTKALKIFNHLGVAGISRRTFHDHQRFYLNPAVDTIWKKFQNEYFAQMRQKRIPLTLGGDGRADSPGHCAKFGSYSLVDLDYMLVIDIQLVQSNEVKSSVHMEKEGLARCVKKLKEEQVNIGEIITDRHVQITKFIREEMPTTDHYFDVWHVAKGLKKKLTALSKQKECDILNPWIKSITNHLYWVPASTPNGEGEVMWEKFKSIIGHLQNIHVHPGKYFTRCEHGDLTGRESEKQWLKWGTYPFVKLQDLLLSNQMEKDVKKLSPGAQTSCLEAFHSIVNHFAPKMTAFSYHGMKTRLKIAALHYNENKERKQAVTKAGEKRYVVVFPKYKKGEYTLRDIKTDCTFGYVQKLKCEVMWLAENVKRHDMPAIERAPPPLCDGYARPDKLEAIQSSQTRYGK